MKIVEFLQPAAVVDDVSGLSGPAVLAELSRPLAVARKVDPQRLLETLLEREKLGSTGIGDGVAIPHGKVPGLPGLMRTRPGRTSRRSPASAASSRTPPSASRS